MSTTNGSAYEIVTLGRRKFYLKYLRLPGLRRPNPGERARLRASIKENGVRDPIKVNKDNEVIDGATRLQIAAELGLSDRAVPTHEMTFDSPEQERKLALELNVMRRQLNEEEVRKAIEAELKANPRQSDAAVAAKTGSTGTTVGKVRGKAEAAGEIPRATATVGKDGKTRKKPAKKAKKKADDAPTVNPLGLSDAMARPEAPAPKAVLDVLGNEVPAAAVVSFNSRDESNNLARELEACAETAKVLLDNEFCKFALGTGVRKIIDELTIAAKFFRINAAHCVCPECVGGEPKKSCGYCGGTGVVSKGGYDRLSAPQRKKIGGK